MKNRLKLNALSEMNLTDRKMNDVRGGDSSCSGSCYYANSGGSSSANNAKANYALRLQNFLR